MNGGRLSPGGSGTSGAGDEVGQHVDERSILTGEPDGLGACRVDYPDAVVSAMPMSA